MRGPEWLDGVPRIDGAPSGGMLGGPLSARARPSTLTLTFAGLLGSSAAFMVIQTWLAA